MQVRLLITTVSNRRQAQRLAKALVQKRLAACVSILPSVRSHYMWKGRLQSSSEEMLLVKTRSTLWNKLCAYLQDAHPYDVPELLEIPVSRSGSSYLGWLKSVIG